MEGSTIFGLFIAIVTIVATIIQANESRKKKEEERRKKVEAKAVIDAGTGRRPASTPARAGGRSLAQILEELAREASGGDSRGDFTSDGEFADAEEYGTAEYLGTETSSDWQGGVYSVEDADAEARYVGGEMRPAARHSGGESGRAARYVGGEMSQSSRRLGGEMAPAARYVGGEMTPRLAVAAADDSAGDTAQDTTVNTHPRELFEGGFDLRRAVIEAEILTPKYITKY